MTKIIALCIIGFIVISLGTVFIIRIADDIIIAICEDDIRSIIIFIILCIVFAILIYNFGLHVYDLTRAAL